MDRIKSEIETNGFAVTREVKRLLVWVTQINLRLMQVMQVSKQRDKFAQRFWSSKTKLVKVSL